MKNVFGQTILKVKVEKREKVRTKGWSTGLTSHVKVK